MENGTSIEYFNNGYIMQVKDKIKVYEKGKKAARTLSQAQQTKLLLEARGGGQTKQPKRTLKRHVEQNSDGAEDEVSGNERKYLRSDQAVPAYTQDFPINSDDEDCDQIIVEQPRQTPKPIKTTKKQPQINYTSPQVDLEELIRLRTENSFIKQQHQDSVKQVEKYKANIKSYKSKKYQEEQESQQQSEPIQEQEQEQAQEIQFRDCDLI
ncbi:MAG: hypothetical protein EZS28_030783 [Streblomastix strix]|uniref:Uncharacterized protein n=1 Tax=Streblomastix strix TaxID=222440 RepID=A0A5J4UUZ3_9EUKA|nr:MAG: hypothetical protein EZS28_030783 [Streblomastix strix]